MIVAVRQAIVAILVELNNRAEVLVIFGLLFLLIDNKSF